MKPKAPSAVWSTGGLLAVALALHDRKRVAAMGYTVRETLQRVYDGMASHRSG